MTNFNQCPNCNNPPPSGSLWDGNHFKIYECDKCGTCYCYQCGYDRCPNCGSKEYSEAGNCWAKGFR